MQNESTKITVGLRFWNDSFSLKGVAACFPGKVECVYDAGETMCLPSGELSTRAAPRHYLALKEYETHEPKGVPALVKQCLRDLGLDSAVALQVKKTSIETVLYVAVFGSQKVSINELGIDPEALGNKIGLVVENYTSFNEAGQPEKWLEESRLANNAQFIEGCDGRSRNV